MRGNAHQINRRQFIKKGTSAVSFSLISTITLTKAEQEAEPPVTHYKGETPPLKVGLIGCGTWGREILRTLSLIPFGPVVAICDIYQPYLNRAARMVEGVKKYNNYLELLEDPEVEGVIVATPTHTHKQIVIDAIKAGKHVYCEAPIASTIEDVKAIASVARDAIELNFQVGLQNRSDNQIVHLEKDIIKSGVLGIHLKCRGQHHEKNSWRRSSPDPDQEKALNWRLDDSISLGLVGEVGIHHIDLANWFYKSPPVAVWGKGTLMYWTDGRDIPDNIIVVLEYPGGIFMEFEATLANSYNKSLDIFFGTNCAILVKDRRAWMFKEADAPTLGFEIYALKQSFFDETGILLGAGSTTQEAREKEAKGEFFDPKTPLQYSLESFLINSYNHSAAVKDFKSTFGETDKESLVSYLKELEQTRLPAAGWQEGLISTITAIKANEAIKSGRRIEIKQEDFTI